MATRLTSRSVPPALWTRATGDWGDQDPLLPLPGYFPDDAERWFDTHYAQCSDPARTRARVVLVGDSITEGWKAPEQSALWLRVLAPLPTHIVAIGGDRTQQILWRFEHGALEGLSPAIVVLLAGVNNLWSMRQDNVQVARGLAAVVRGIRARLPRAHILHVGILPHQNSSSHPLRKAAVRVNRLAADQSRAAGAEFVEWDRHFLAADGSLTSAIAPDLVHLSPSGYAILGGLLQPYLARFAPIP